jgi:hypothetical protein
MRMGMYLQSGSASPLSYSLAYPVYYMSSKLSNGMYGGLSRRGYRLVGTVMELVEPEITRPVLDADRDDDY